MKMTRLSPLLLALLVGALAPLAARAASQAYLQVEGIPGEAVAPGHEGWVEVLQLTNTLARGPGSGTPDPPGVRGSLSILKRVDKASPLLLLAGAAGTVIPGARLDLVTTNGSALRFYQLQLSNVVVRALHSTGAALIPESRSLEQCELSFQHIRWSYTELRPRSRLPLAYHDSWWDLARETGASSSTLARFEVTGIQQGPKHVVLSWQPESGRTYAVYSSASVDGPFTLLGRVTATSDAVIYYPVPLSAPALFFAVEQEL